jgi:hypothetical protein
MTPRAGFVGIVARKSENAARARATSCLMNCSRRNPRIRARWRVVYQAFVRAGPRSVARCGVTVGRVCRRLSTPSTDSTPSCVCANDDGEWSDTGTGDTHSTQGAGTFGGRGVRALLRPSRSMSRADHGRPGKGRATPDGTHVRAGGTPSLARSRRLPGGSGGARHTPPSAWPGMTDSVPRTVRDVVRESARAQVVGRPVARFSPAWLGSRAPVCRDPAVEAVP